MNLKSEAQWNRIKIVFEEPSLNPRIATALEQHLPSNRVSHGVRNTKVILADKACSCEHFLFFIVERFQSIKIYRRLLREFLSTRCFSYTFLIYQQLLISKLRTKKAI